MIIMALMYNCDADDDVNQCQSMMMMMMIMMIMMMSLIMMMMMMMLTPIAAAPIMPAIEAYSAPTHLSC